MESLSITKSKMPLRSPTTTPMLAPELWSYIFQYLSPEDLFSISNTCPDWNELLKDKKTTYLFSLVLPLVMGHVERNTLFNCRSVTKSSKAGFDKTLQSFCNSDDVNPFRNHYGDPICQRRLREVASTLTRYYDLSHVNFKVFLQKVFPDFSTTSSEFNPFLLRHIALGNRNGDVYLPGHDVLSILPKFGHHLVSLDLIIKTNTFDMLFSRFVSQLSLVPNLKRLELDLFVFQTGTKPIHLARPKTSYNFPKLVNLVHFDVKDVQPTGKLYCMVLTMLETYGHQLTSFTCSPTLLTASFLSVDKLNILFPNIKKLKLAGINLHFSEALSKLSEISWPLEHLYLQMSYFWGSLQNLNYLNGQIVFSALNHFHQSLVHLHLNCMLLPSLAQSNVNHIKETVQKYNPMSKLKIIITNDHIMEENLFCTFLKENCQQLQQLHVETWDIQERAKGRWAFEHLSNLEKVVFWNSNVATFDELGRAHTMRRSRSNPSVMDDSGIAGRK